MTNRSLNATHMLSIVIPAHNEVGYLETIVRDLTDALRARERSFEVIVVENGSTDMTFALARQLAAEVPELQVRSRTVADYGAALRDGLLAARGELVVTFDVDFYDLDFADRALALLERSPSTAIVVGSKRAPGAQDTRPWPRRVVTGVFTTILRTGFGLGVSDTHGMKAMRREAVRALVQECCFTTDLFDTELVLRAEQAGLGVVDLPVIVEERRPARTPMWKRVPRTVVGLVRLRRLLHPAEERSARNRRARMSSLSGRHIQGLDSRPALDDRTRRPGSAPQARRPGTRSGVNPSAPTSSRPRVGQRR